jgi:hypothetical protein
MLKLYVHYNSMVSNVKPIYIWYLDAFYASDLKHKEHHFLLHMVGDGVTCDRYFQVERKEPAFTASEYIRFNFSSLAFQWNSWVVNKTCLHTRDISFYRTKLYKIHFHLFRPLNQTG